MQFIKKYLFTFSTLLFAVGIILTVFVVLPFWHTGFFPSHDGEWAVVRAGEMFREIRDHQFPPRYSGALNFGYGYLLIICFVNCVYSLLYKIV